MIKQVIHYITSTLVPEITNGSGLVNIDRQPNFLQSTGM